MPVIAKELEYREYCSGIYLFLFFVNFFPPLSTISPGWKADSLWRPEKSKQEVKT